jgi:hypothetical protein
MGYIIELFPSWCFGGLDEAAIGVTLVWLAKMAMIKHVLALYCHEANFSNS